MSEANELAEAVASLQIRCDEISELVEAQAQDESGDVDEDVLVDALESYKKVIELNDTVMDAHFGVAYVCGMLGLFEEAQSTLDYIAEIEGEESERTTAMKEGLSQLILEAGGKAGDDEDGEENISSVLLIESEDEANTLQLSPQFERVLQEVFTRFDSDQDGALSDSELDKFFSTVNGAPADEATKAFIAANFACNEANHLIFDGFKGLYASQAVGDTDEVFKDLRELGYGRDLTPLSQ